LSSKTLTIESVDIVLKLKEKNIDLYNNLMSVHEKVEPLLNKRISQVFKYYTLHDINHSVRIMDYMGKLVPDLDQLNAFELVLLAYSALLHDIGMAASEEEIKQIKKGNLKYGELDYQSFLEKFNGDHDLAIQDYIRRVHAYRSSEYIRKNLKKQLIIPNMSNTTFEDQVALICQSHTEDFIWIKQNLNIKGEKGSFSYNPQFCAIILRLADILDFDSQRTPPVLFDSLSPQGISKDEWIQHFSIENINKIKYSNNGYKLIELHGRCTNPFIHRKLLSYIDWINSEINHANDLSQIFSEVHRIFLHPKVYDFIKSDGYTIADMKFKVNYNEITKLLMGENLYGNKKFGLRELIQNSIDACKLKKEILDNKYEFGEEEYKGIIKIILDKDKNEVIIKDDGIGMDIHVLKNYFLKLGASFYNSDDYMLKGYSYKPIGNYGIGFLASFMLSDEVKVKTRHMNNSVLYEVDINKFDEFVCINHNPEHLSHGTEVILKYDQFMNVWEDLDKLKEFLSSHFLTDEVKIQYINKNTMEKQEVNNCLLDDSLKHTIKLSDYLNDIDGQVSLDINNIFVNEIDDLSYIGEPLVYNGENLIPLDDLKGEYDLLDFIQDNKMNVLNFPVIEDADDLEKILDIIEDTKEAFEKYEDRYNSSYITIIANEETIDEAVLGFIDASTEFLRNLFLDRFVEYGQDIYAGTLITLEEMIIFNIGNHPLFLVVNPIRSSYRYIRRNEFKLFVRDVFVSSIDLDVPFKIEDLSVKDLKVNVKNSDIKPDVTRNFLKSSDLELLKHAIYIAICFSIYEGLDDEIKKKTLLGYLKKYQKRENKFIKNKYERLLLE